MTVFGGYADYYDLLYLDKNYVAESIYLSQLISRFGDESHKSILELGCGTGRHALELFQLGYNVCGIDRSLAMLEHAAMRDTDVIANRKFNFLEADVRSFRASEAFDSVLACFHVVNYQTTDDDLEQMFMTAAQNLKSGGLFIFDSWYGPAVLTQKPDVRVKRVRSDDIEVVRIAEPTMVSEENLVMVNYTLWVRHISSGVIRVFKEEHRIRFLFMPEIKRLCAGAGLKLMHAEEWLTTEPVGLTTWGVCCVAQR